MTHADNIIAFQGEPGAYSHLAAHENFPGMEAVACATFEDAFQTIAEGRARLGMIPIENSLAGRVADIHHLLPDSGLFIVGERFAPVHHQLMAPKGATLDRLKSVQSHSMALGQVRKTLRALNLKSVVGPDTAGSARLVAEAGDVTRGAVASKLAAEIYGLDILKADIEDAVHNTTRFLVMSREPDHTPMGNGPVVTTFVFRVRNVPGALYKALGGFATNGVNMTKLESYQLGGTFRATQFYADIEGHPNDRLVSLAMEELQFFTTHIKILGIYPADPYRNNGLAV